MSWIGKCTQCGECCRDDVSFMTFTDIEEKKIAYEFLLARGIKIIDSSKGNSGAIATKHTQICKMLKGDLCVLHSDGKPEQCKRFPIGFEKVILEYGLSFEKILPAQCGFKWIAD